MLYDIGRDAERFFGRPDDQIGIVAGLAWVEIFNTTGLEGYSGMLVFFTFMPLGAIIGGLGGALLFGVLALRDAAIAIEREPIRHDP